MIVIKSNAFIKTEELNRLREIMLSQAKDGLIIVPNFCSVYIDPQPGDVKVQVEGAKL